MHTLRHTDAALTQLDTEDTRYSLLTAWQPQETVTLHCKPPSGDLTQRQGEYTLAFGGACGLETMLFFFTIASSGREAG